MESSEPELPEWIEDEFGGVFELFVTDDTHSQHFLLAAQALLLQQILTGGKVAQRTMLPIRREFLATLVEALFEIARTQKPLTNERSNELLKRLRVEFINFQIHLLMAGLRERSGEAFYFGNHRITKDRVFDCPGLEEAFDEPRNFEERRDLIESFVATVFYRARHSRAPKPESQDLEKAKGLVACLIESARFADFDPSSEQPKYEWR